MIFMIFGKNCSKVPRKVVSAGARDQKSAVRAHLVTEKLSLASYFCPQTCSEPEWTHIFPGRDPGWSRLGPAKVRYQNPPPPYLLLFGPMILDATNDYYFLARRDFEPGPGPLEM